MQKLIRFIKYNNAFVIILGLIFASAGGVFANETSRDAIIGKTVVTRIGVDNSRIVGTDLGSFNMDFKITKVTEDDRGYNIGYSYNTIYIKDNVWQPLIKEGEMYVSKAGLGDKDLGLYIADELGQKADREVAYLKEVQSIEKSKGVLKQTESVEYTGLKGLVFNSGTKEIAGYNPVKENEDQKAEVAGVFNPSTKTETEEENKGETGDNENKTETGPQVTVVKEVVSRETIMKMVKEALAKEKGITLSNASTTDTDALSSASSTAVSSSSSVVSGGGGGGEEAAQSSSSSSSSFGSESPTSSSSSSSSESSSQSTSSSSESSSVTVSSSSEASSLSSSSESQSSLEATAGQASSSPVSSASSSETASSTSSSSESSSSSSTSSQVESSSSQSSDISSSSISSSSSSTASESSSSVSSESSSQPSL